MSLFPVVVGATASLALPGPPVGVYSGHPGGESSRGKLY